MISVFVCLVWILLEVQFCKKLDVVLDDLFFVQSNVNHQVS